MSGSGLVSFLSREQHYLNQHCLDVCRTAAIHGDADSLRHVLRHLDPHQLIVICRLAAQHGHVECLACAYTQDCHRDEGVCEAAAQYGHLDCLRYAHEHGFPLGEDCVVLAARCGQFECLEYLILSGCPCPPDDVADGFMHIHALHGGDVRCLQLLYERAGCTTWSDETCHRAAADGMIDFLQYLHEHECPWDERTWVKAIAGKHLDCLRYAYENGCPMKKTFVNPGPIWGVDILRFLESHNLAYDLLDVPNHLRGLHSRARPHQGHFYTN